MWDEGYGFGAAGGELEHAVEAMAEDIGRSLTPTERAELCRGWNAGRAERTAAKVIGPVTQQERDFPL